MNQVIFVIGRSLQIFKTFKERDAKQLSLGSYGTVVLGKTIRVFTSIKEGASLPLHAANALGNTAGRMVSFELKGC